MKSIILVLLALSLFTLVVRADDVEAVEAVEVDTADAISPIFPRVQTLTVDVMIPDYTVCPNCYIIVGTSLNWTLLTPDPAVTNPAADQIAKKIAPNTYRFTTTYTRAQVGQEVTIAVHYNARSRTGADTLILQAIKCKFVLDNLTAKSLGSNFYVTLTNGGTYTKVYPFFCRNRGVIEEKLVFVPHLNLSKIAYTYISPALDQNPLPRPVKYLVMIDAFALPDAIALALDSLISTGHIRPDIIVFGLGEGLPHDPYTPIAPWNGGGARANELIVGMGNKGLTTLVYLATNLGPSVAAEQGFPVQGNRYGIFGWSLGGALACWGAVSNSTLYSEGYCGSPTTSFDTVTVPFAPYASQPTAQPIRLFVDCSENEDKPHIVTPLINVLVPALESNPSLQHDNFRFHYYTGRGDSHQWTSWFQHFYRAARFLWPPVHA